ncbi:MAG TPA: hypothetical protein VGJ20_08585 [Xanthobacteraceae bacterium]
MTAITRAGMIRSLFGALSVAFAAGRNAQAQASKPHRVVIQIDQNDEAVMRLALNNARNALDYYRDRDEAIEIEIVAYGPGLAMLRDDTSPVKDRIKDLSLVRFPAKVVFSACNNTKTAMERREGHPITMVPQATMVAAGVVRIIELQEQGYCYVRP